MVLTGDPIYKCWSAMNPRTSKFLLKCSIFIFILVFLLYLNCRDKKQPVFENSGLLSSRESYSSLNNLFTVTLEEDSNQTTVIREDCRMLLQQVRNREVTDTSLQTLLVNCHDHIRDGLFQSEFLGEVLKDFEEKCSSKRQFLAEARPLIALASYPGSGNTWNRELIEATTGIHTGSVYTDWNFEGSRDCPSRGKTFVIKSHFMSGKTLHSDCTQLGTTDLNFTKAILILRNPFHALLAEFNRQTSSKRSSSGNPGVKLAGQSDFKSREWDRFVNRESDYWMNMVIYWRETFRQPVYVLVYEQVQKYTMTEMYLLTKFLDLTVPFNALYCLSSGSVGNFHRQKPDWMTADQLFDTAHRKIVNEKILKLVGMFHEKDKLLTDVLKGYLML